MKRYLIISIILNVVLFVCFWLGYCAPSFAAMIDAYKTCQERGGKIHWEHWVEAWPNSLFGQNDIFQGTCNKGTDTVYIKMINIY